MEEIRNAYAIFVGRSEGNKSLGRPIRPGKEWDERVLAGFNWSRIESTGGLF
jgi:hypothetical protein